ncbi:MAG: hypothetical protein DRP66_04480 [Planctomycetota bacterium]|nr:MAG: hypothetical protein DRP66_04480 [Planctomycetota bacterium]
MGGAFTVNLDRPVNSAVILHDYQVDAASPIASAMNPADGAERIGLMDDLQSQKDLYGEACRMLEGAAGKLNRFYDEAVAGHKEEIAGLSVEIARKILAQKVADGDYEIEAIVKEALKNAPMHEDIVIRVNPQDLAACRKVRRDDAGGAPVGVKFVADQNIGRAECVLESPKGVIKSVIDEHLEQIGKALEKAE